MNDNPSSKPNKVFAYILWALVGYVGILTGYHSIKIIRLFIKPVDNPLMPLVFYKGIAFPYISFIPFLLGILFLGVYFIRKRYFKKVTVIFYVILILLFHLFQNNLFDLFNSFNPYNA